MATSKGNGKGKGLTRQALKEFRSSVAILKRKGLVSKRTDARSQQPTRYMRAKVRALAPVIEGNAIAVKAPRKVREQYSDSGVLDVKYNRIIAPKEFANQRARLSRGMVQMVRKLKNGQEEYVILPFKPATANDLIERLISDPTLDGLKDETEYFSFRLYGHNSQQALFTAKEMGEYLRAYKVLQGNYSREAVKHLTFQRFRGDPVETGYGGYANPHESTEPKVIHKRADDTGRNTGRNNQREGTYEKQQREKRRYRKAEQRSKETEIERTRRLCKQQVRQARYRQRKFKEK